MTRCITLPQSLALKHGKIVGIAADHGGHALAWELVRTFLLARFSDAERHRRCLEKVMAIENPSSQTVIGTLDNAEKISHEGIATQSKPLKIYVMRHGETEWSLSGRYTGSTDIPLTAHGEDAARELGRPLRDIPFTHVPTSPRQRARQTFALAGFEPMADVEPDLAEWDHGDDEGITPAEICVSRPDWNLFHDGSLQLSLLQAKEAHGNGGRLTGGKTKVARFLL